MKANLPDAWDQGSPYEAYIGRWSRQIAPLFLAWLDPAPGLRWIDVGCGTGALSAAILERSSPASVVGIDPSEGFLALARERLGDRARLLAGDAAALPVAPGACQMLVSGLVLNFVPDLPAALAEMRRVTVPGGGIAAYVWDYADAMEITRRFWDAAAALDATAAQLHEGVRFPLCRPEALRAAFDAAGLTRVETTALELTARFTGFDDYWQPFLGGQGPAPAYAMSLSEPRREQLRASLASTMPVAADGTIALKARAWAVRGLAPEAA